MYTLQIVAVLCVAFLAVTLASHHGYEFSYGVEDHHTGDSKSQKEKGHDGHVTGYYKLKEADGTDRIVHYSADKHSGFSAHVERKGHAYHPEHYHHHEHHGHGGHHGGHGKGYSYQNFHLENHGHGGGDDDHYNYVFSHH